jgi:hypothetical protein
MGTDGRIYLATDDGVVIYDGIFFKQLGLKDGMKSQSVYAIFPIFDKVITHSFKGSNIINGITIDKVLSNKISKMNITNSVISGIVHKDLFFQMSLDSLFVFDKNLSLKYKGKIIKHSGLDFFSFRNYFNTQIEFESFKFYLNLNQFIGISQNFEGFLYLFNIKNNQVKKIIYSQNSSMLLLISDSNVYFKENGIIYLSNFLTSNQKTKILQIDNLNSIYVKDKKMIMSSKKGLFLLHKNNKIKSDKNYILNEGNKEKLKKYLFIGALKCHFENPSSKEIYIGTSYGLYKYHINNRYRKYLINNRITSIAYKENLWVGSNNCIYKLDINEKITILKSKMLGDAKINSIVFESDSLLWISSEGNGIFNYNLNTKIIQSVNLGNFQISNNFHKIYIDPKNRKWLLSENGIIVIDGDKKKIMRTQEGLLSNRAIHLYFKGDTTYIYYEKGRDILKYDSILNKEKIPLVFNEFKVSGEKYDSLPCVLSPDQNKISIQMVGIFFPSPKDIIYRYRLERNENLSEWRWYNSNDLNFDELNYGKYSLQIQAINKFNPFIHSEIKKFQFEIEPFWYQRPIIWILFSILLVSIVVLVLFQSYKKRQNRIMRDLATESKLNLYRLNGLQNQINPHFVFNSLNTLQYLITTKKEEKTNQYLTDFSLMMREMLNQSRYLQISLEDEIQFLKKYISLEKIRFSDTFDCKWKNSIAEEEWSEIFIPNMLIQPLIENAIKYGIPNSKEDAKFIEIKMDLLESNILEVVIIDHGKWIERESLAGQAHSLMITKERLELYEKNGVKGNLDILKNSTGSEVKLNIPI